MQPIAIVILNWNGKKLLEQFLPKVIKRSKNAKIYVADNASTDLSIAYVQSQFKSVTVIKNKTNGGYAKGYNDALQHVEEPILCLLNSDIEVSKNWLPPILETFENNPKTAIIQPKIRDFKNKQKFEYAGAAGGFIDKYAYPYCRGRIFNTLENDNQQYDDVTDIFWASGACLFIRNSVFKTLNGFDTTFFAHMEEIDLCWRAKNLGYVIKYVPESVVYHVGGATLNASNPKKTYLNFRNSLFTLTKNTNNTLFPLIFKRLLIDGVAGLRFLTQLKPLHTLAVLKAHFSYYYNLPRLLKQRKTLTHKSPYFTTPSIVWEYYVNNKKTYEQL